MAGTGDLASQLAAYIGADGAFSLPTTAFTQAGQAALAPVLGSGVLRIEGAGRPAASDDGVVVTGLATLWTMASLPARAVFWQDAGGLQATVTYALPAGWSPSDSFPAYRGSQLNQVPLADAAFTIATTAAGTAAGAGVSFAADVGLGPFAPLAELLGSGTVRASGPVTLNQGIPEFALTVPLASAGLGGLTAPLALQLNSELVVPADPSGATWATAWFALVADLSVGSGPGAVTVPVSVTFSTSPGTVLEFSMDLQDAADCALSDLGALAGGRDLLAVMPQAFRPGGAVTLFDVSIGVTVRPPRVGWISLTVVADLDWAVAPGLTVTAITAQFTVVDPFGGGSAVDLRLDGAVTVGGTEVDVSAGSDPVMFTGTLPEGASIDLNGLLASWFPQLSLPTFTLASLQVIVAPGRTYALAIDLDDGWTLPLGPASVSLTGLSLALSRDLTATPALTSGFLTGTLALGPATLSAHYDLSGDFMIQGIVAAVSLKDLIDTLGGGTFSYPSQLPDVVLSQVTVGIDRAGQDYRLTFGTTVSDLGTAEFLITRTAAGWGFAGAFILPAGWKLSALPGVPAAFDDLVISNAALLLASVSDPGLTVPSLQLPPGFTAGVAVTASLAPVGLGLDILARAFAIPAFRVDAAIATSGITLDATLADPLAIGSVVTFHAFGLAFSAGTAGVSVDLHAELTLAIHDQSLTFRGDAIISEDLVEFSLGLVGTWQPFGPGTVGIKNTTVALKVVPVLAVGVAGEIDFGDGTAVTIAADAVDAGEAVDIDLVIGELDGTISLPQLLGLIAPGAIPSTAAQYLAVSLSNFQLYLVTNPLGVSIGQQHYPPGFRLTGTLAVYDITGSADVSVDSGNPGVHATGSLSEIRFGDVLAVSDVQLLLDFRAADITAGVFSFTGTASLLGITVSLTVLLTQTQYRFSFSATIFGSFGADIDARAALGSVLAADFSVSAVMHGDLLSYLASNAAAVILTAVQANAAALQSAQQNVTAAQATVNGLNSQISARQQAINAANQAAGQQLTSAQSQVEAALAQVNSLQAQIDADTSELQNLSGISAIWQGPQLAAEIAGLEISLRAAQGVLTAAQGTLAALQQTTVIINPAADPQYIALQAALQTATLALTAAQQALAGAQAASQATAQTAAYIAGHGLASFLIVEDASFAGRLATVNGGSVTMAVTLLYCGQPQAISLSFDFTNPIDAARQLAQQLLNPAG